MTIKVEFSHRRLYKTDAHDDEWKRNPRMRHYHRMENIPSEELSPTGGVTFCYIMYDDEILAQGRAICRPDENFSKKIGRNISIGRAVRELEGLL